METRDAKARGLPPSLATFFERPSKENAAVRRSSVGGRRMISILSSVTELERAHQLRSTVLDCYLLAIKNIANYTVELDDENSSPHRQFLEQLAADVATDQTEALLASRATLRGL